MSSKRVIVYTACMRIHIKTKDLDLTPPLKEFIDQKVGSLEKFIKKYDEGDSVLAEVEASRTTKHHHKGNVFYAEINLHLPKKMLRAESTDFDARVAINKAKEILKREIEKYKETHE